MSYNILVAEDEQEIAGILRLYLEKEGYQVFWARDGMEALEWMEKEEISMDI